MPMQDHDNIILDTDSYKVSHFRQYPADSTALFGYLESRGGRYGETLFFGLQPILERMEKGVTLRMIEEAERLMRAHGEPFPSQGWRHIVAKHAGHLPLRIRAVREGAIVPVRNVLLTVESTDPEVPWLVGWFETMLMRIWYPITVATRSLYCKRAIWNALKETSDDPVNEMPFKLHDFGGRGVSSFESAGIGGAAHLVNFLGTDTIAALTHIAQHYSPEGAYKSYEKTPGFSIPAMEHSTVTAWGRKGEAEAYQNMIRSNPEYKLIACVSDSYNIFEAVENIWADELVDEVKASGKTIVIRPDSGDPVEVNLKILQILERKVGMRTNTKGYKVLPKYFRIIQGDGNDDEGDIAKILSALQKERFSATNIAFGMGGGLLQKLDRDTQRFAFKLCAIKRSGTWHDVRKEPITDTGKSSKAGRLDLMRTGGTYGTVPLEDHQIALGGSEMETVFDGTVKRWPSFDDIRELAGREFK